MKPPSLQYALWNGREFHFPDVSRHQNLNGNPPPPVAMAIVKLTEGDSWEDPEAAEMIQFFSSRGIMVLGYHWLRPDKSVPAQVEHYARVAAKYPVIKGHMTDVERTEINGHDLGIPTKAQVDEYHRGLALKVGRGKICCYMGMGVPYWKEWRKENKDMGWILPHYGRSGPYMAKLFGADALQFSGTARMSCFSTLVDANYVLDWTWFASLQGAVVSPPPPPPATQGSTVPVPGAWLTRSRYLASRLWPKTKRDRFDKSLRLLQDYLRWYHWSSGPTDGILGPVTVSGIRNMQRYLGGLKVDGKYGPRTQLALYKYLTRKKEQP